MSVTEKAFRDISLNHKTACDKTTGYCYYLQFPDGKAKDRKGVVTFLVVPAGCLLAGLAGSSLYSLHTPGLLASAFPLNYTSPCWNHTYYLYIAGRVLSHQVLCASQF